MTARKSQFLRTRGRAGHRGINSLCRLKRVQKTDIAAALDISTVQLNWLFQNPLRMNGGQIITIAGLCSVSPEFILYVIRFNDHKTETPPETTTQLEDFKAQFPV